MPNELSVTADAEAGGEYPEGLYQNNQLAELLPNLGAIGPDEVAQYRENGFLAVRSGLDSAQVAAALDGLTSLVLDPRGADIQYESWAADRLDEFDGPARLDVIRRFMQFVDRAPRLHSVAFDERLLSVVRQLAGDDDVVLFQDMALLKPPGAGREKPWHQDNAFFPIEPGSSIVGVWIALDEATLDNGCVHVIPGSHREGPVIHFRRRDWQICDTDVQTWRDVAVPLPPGGVLLFDALLHHGTPTNRSARRRRALQFHYMPAATARHDDTYRLAIFGPEGKNVTC